MNWRFATDAEYACVLVSRFLELTSDELFVDDDIYETLYAGCSVDLCEDWGRDKIACHSGQVSHCLAVCTCQRLHHSFISADFGTMVL
jgi:hypothetical protein